MAKTVTLVTPGAKAHYSASNIDSNFSTLNSNFTNFLHLNGTSESSNTILGNIDMGGKRATNAGAPSLSSDYATKGYVDALVTITTTVGTIGSLLTDDNNDTGVQSEASADLNRLDLFAASSAGAENAIQIVGNDGAAAALTNPYVEVLKHVVLETGVRIGDAASADTYLELNRSGAANEIFLVAGGNTVADFSSTVAEFQQDVRLYDAAATAAGKKIGDEDGDTYIQFNQATGGTDDDTIRFYCGGVAIASFSGSTIDLGGGTFAADDLLIGGATMPGDGEDNVIIFPTGTTVATVSNLDDNTVVLYSTVNTGVQNDLKLDFKTGASTKSTVILGKDCTFPNNIAVSGASTFTGAVTINDTTASSSKDTGALIVEGGVGVEEDVYVGGQIVVTGNLDVDGTASIDGMAADHWPSCWAYLASDSTARNFTTQTELVFDTENFDTNNNFNISTGRFTPTVAGKYLVIARVAVSAWTLTASVDNFFAIRKNSGSPLVEGVISHGEEGTTGKMIASGIFDMNGTTDYLSAWLKISTDASVTWDGGQSISYISISRIA